MRADSLLVEKHAHRLTMFVRGGARRVVRVALGPHPEGDKQYEGDGRTPEGVYRIDYKLWASRYHHALHLSYPDDAHRQRARARGLRPGGDIMIHGQPNELPIHGLLHIPWDWTAGCIAVSDREIDEIWRLVPVGTQVRVVP